MARGDHRQRRCSPQGSIRRCWLLLGEGSRRALCSGLWTRSSRRSRPAPAGLCHRRTRRSVIPRHPLVSVSQGPGSCATDVTDQAGSDSATHLRHDGTVEPVCRPDQAGPGIPAVPAAGWAGAEGERRSRSHDLVHRPQPRSNCSALASPFAQESTGERWASPTASGQAFAHPVVSAGGSCAGSYLGALTVAGATPRCNNSLSSIQSPPPLAEAPLDCPGRTGAARRSSSFGNVIDAANTT